MNSKLDEILLTLTKPMSSKEAFEYIKKKHLDQSNHTVMGKGHLDSVAIEHLKEKKT